MCQATVYVGDEEVAQEVIRLDQVEGGVRIATFFEEPKVVPSHICHIAFLKHQVFLEPIEEGENGRD